MAEGVSEAKQQAVVRYAFELQRAAGLAESAAEQYKRNVVERGCCPCRSLVHTMVVWSHAAGAAGFRVSDRRLARWASSPANHVLMRVSLSTAVAFLSGSWEREWWLSLMSSQFIRAPPTDLVN